MSKRFLRTIIAVAPILTVAAFPGGAEATPLTLDYTATDIGGGLFDYEFFLTLDNNDNTWGAGQGWGWLIFGDQEAAASPLTSFIGDSGDLPIGPWTFYASTSGFHNGPTLGAVTDKWVPANVGDSLFWSGTSTANLGQGEMLWSTLLFNGGAVGADFTVANLIPEPTSLSLLAFGCLALIRRR